MKREETQVYYVDGYHGGLKGHMPYGCWPDILHVFHEIPSWKITIEVEPISWEHIKATDPVTYDALKNDLFATKNQDRVEIVSGSYAQPYGWVIGGESNIRQLIRGLRLHKAHFPDVVIDTYAVQEPCWTSSLPQILRSLGYKRATLKNPATAWAGYSRGFDQSAVQWTGPDGTAIPCVPRYACENLLDGSAWSTECERMEPDFVDKCLANRIAKPVGSQFQDLGWPAGPNLGVGYATYVTWRQYFSEVIDEPVVSWRFSQEDILCTLPWGEKRLQCMARQVRSAENRIVTAEKLAAWAMVAAGASYPAGKLAQSWDQLMMAQHHDAWICVPSREDRANWGWLAGAQTWLVEEACDEVINQSVRALCREMPENKSWKHLIKVFNPLGCARQEPVSLDIPMLEGCRSVAVYDSTGERITSQETVLRTSDDGSINAVRLIFMANISGFSGKTYLLDYLSEAQVKADDLNARQPAADVSVSEESDGSRLTLETDRYKIILDLARGGTITRLYHKPTDRDLGSPDSPYCFNEYRGYLPQFERQMSSAASPAKAEILEKGPVRLVVRITSQLATNQITTTLTLIAGQDLIDFHVRADFDGEQWIGDPCTIAPDEVESQRVRSHHDSFRNFHMLLPFHTTNGRIDKNAAYDVCRSQHSDTRFRSWDAIKHNIILNWIDIYDETTDSGLAILSDHTTSYGHSPDYPVHLTFAWSGDAGFWWGKCPLHGHQEMRYALLPHAGDWEQSLVSQTSAAWNEPLICLLDLAAPDALMDWKDGLRQQGTMGFDRSLFTLSDDHIEITAFYVDEGKLLIRLFHAGREARQAVLAVGLIPVQVEQTEVDGSLIRRLEPILRGDGTCEIHLDMAPFGIRTLAFTF